MIEIKINLDSVENEEDSVIFRGEWDILSETITKAEEDSAKFILQGIEGLFNDLCVNALLQGGSVMHRKDKDEK